MLRNQAAYMAISLLHHMEMIQSLKNKIMKSTCNKVYDTINLLISLNFIFSEIEVWLDQNDMNSSFVSLIYLQKPRSSPLKRG